MGVGVVASPSQDLYAPSTVVSETQTGDDASYIHRVDTPTPRAWLVSNLLSMDDADALPLLAADRHDPSRTALLPPGIRGQGGTLSGRKVGLEDGWVSDTDGAATTVEQVHPGFLRIHVNSAHGGYLAVSENWMPGWEATLVTNGERRAAPVVRTNVTFLGVPVRPGEVTVELRYRPASARFGLLISALAALLLLALSFPAVRRPLATVRVNLRARVMRFWSVLPCSRSRQSPSPCGYSGSAIRNCAATRRSADSSAWSRCPTSFGQRLRSRNRTRWRAMSFKAPG